MKTKTVTTIGLFTALLCIVAPITVPIPISPIPLSLATLVIYFLSNLLGYKKAILCCSMYLIIGLAGIPVFSGFTSGVAKLVGPTGGYLIGYFFVAFFTGFFAEKFRYSVVMQLFGMVIGTVVMLFFGTLWLSALTHTTMLQAALSAVLPFLLGDILKIVITILLAPLIKKYMAKAQLSFE